MCAFAVLGVLFYTAAVAQTASTGQKNSAAGGQVPTFQSGVNLVLVPVVVRDGKGQAVGGLTKDSFEVFDEGKRQVIVSFFANTRRSENEEPEPAANAQSEAPASSSLGGLGGENTSANTPRSVVYIVDDLYIKFANLAAVRSALSQHLRSLARTDRAAIHTFSGRPQVDLTNDRDKLADAVAKLRYSMADPVADDAKECPDISYYLADLIVNHGDDRARKAAVGHTVDCAHVTEPLADGMVRAASLRQLMYGPQKSEMALRALRLAVLRLQEMPGDRLIVLTSPGFYAQTPEEISDTEDVLKLAAKAHITISTLDPRGLYTEMKDESETGKPNELWIEYERQRIQAEQGILADLAKGSGGIFMHDNDGFRAAFDRMVRPPEFSYLLGFEPTNSKQDGKFHSIKIRLVVEKGLSIEARNGYYALEQNPSKESARLQVDDAVFSRDRTNGLPVVLQTGYIAPNKGDPTITATIKVEVDSLRFRRAKQRNLDALTVVVALFGEDGGYIVGAVKTVNLQLRDQTLKTHPSVTLHFALPAKRGAYVMRIVVRDAQSGAMSTFTSLEKIT